MRFLPVTDRSAARFASLGETLLSAATAADAPYLAASVVTGPAVLLGASQRAGRVLDLASCRREGVAVHRRTSAGNAAYIAPQTLGFTLALPRVNAIVADASLRTLLNRNVRGFLKGLTRIGAMAHYFGRDWIAVQHRPVALLGASFTPSGAVLLEVIIALDAPFAVPSPLATSLEHASDRTAGKAPIRLRDVLTADASALVLATRIAEAVAARFDHALEPVAEPDAIDAAMISHDDDPLPEGLHPGPPVPCAIGFVEAACSADRSALWLGGDALAPRHVLETIAQRIQVGGDAFALDDGACEGARIEDFRLAANAAFSARA